MFDLPVALRSFGRDPAREFALLRDSLLDTDQQAALPSDWYGWVTTMFGPRLWVNPDTGLIEFAPHHEDFWEHIFSIRSGVRPRPYVACWPRGQGKSTNMEMGCIALGAPRPDPDEPGRLLRSPRSYLWYVSGTQDQADAHVQSIAELLEDETIGRHYPLLASRAVNSFGHSKGWRRSRLWTRQGLIVDALGLDTARRGVKLGDRRPDAIILDDVDSDEDSIAAVDKKIHAITKKLLPAGTTTGDTALFFVQNRPNPRGIMSQMIDGNAEFLQDRVLNGPVPSLVGMETARVWDGESDRFRDVITAGVPTWRGQDLHNCQQLVDNSGLRAFRLENQHENVEQPGGIFSHIDFDAIRSERPPDFIVIAVWVDPAVSNKDQSDSYAICAAALAPDDRIWMLSGWESTPGLLMPEQVEMGDDSNSSEAVLTRALLLAFNLRAQRFGIETDQGGNTWYSVYQRSLAHLRSSGQVPERWEPAAVLGARAGMGFGPKAHRWRQMSVDYDHDRIRHLATPATRPLERALYRAPAKPVDLADAEYWAWRDLRDLTEAPARRASFSLRSV